MYLSRSYMYNSNIHAFPGPSFTHPEKKTYFATFTIDPSQTNIQQHCHPLVNVQATSLWCFLRKSRETSNSSFITLPNSKATDFLGQQKWNPKNFAIFSGPPGSCSSGTSRVVSLESLGRIGFHPELSVGHRWGKWWAENLNGTTNGTTCGDL